MNVLVYVEGPSDKKALEALLRPLILGGHESDRMALRFLSCGGKHALLRDAPHKAAELLAQDPEAWVFVVVDRAHDAAEEIRDKLTKRFIEHADRLGLSEGLRHHLRVHLLVPDLEVLLLAAPEALQRRLDTKDSLAGAFRRPVEGQDAGRPPRQIVEELFQRYQKRPYQPEVDAPLILASASLEQVAQASARYFGPFVAELRGLLEGSEPAREPVGIVEGVMYIHKVVIENVRGLGSEPGGIEIDLQRPDGNFAGWTAIAGRNGAGKSTFLRALALAVAGPDVARSLQKSYAGWLCEGAGSGTVQIWLARIERDRGDGALTHAGSDLELSLRWERLPSGVQPKMTALQQLGKEAPKDLREGPWAENPVGWFVAGYGAFRRLGPALQDGTEPGPIMEARLASLFDDEAHLAEALQWLGKVHADRLVLRERAGKLGEQGDVEQMKALNREASALEMLRIDVLALLNDGLLPDGATIDDFDGRDLWITEGERTLSLRELSDGYRTVAALVCDLVRQLHRAYGSLKIDMSKGFPRVMLEGVVLIDEIETHLHVSWQKRIGFWFKEHFPCVQFIVTTHSPFICQAADPNGLFCLARPGDARTTGPAAAAVYNTVVNGSADDAVMSELFGAERPYSKAAEALREEISALESRLIQGEASKKEKAKLKELSARLPKTPSAEVEQALLKLSAQLGGKSAAKR